MRSEDIAHKKHAPHKHSLVDFDELQHARQTKPADAANIAGDQGDLRMRHHRASSLIV